jgi:hypothetical protein
MTFIQNMYFLVMYDVKGSVLGPGKIDGGVCQ